LQDVNEEYELDAKITNKPSKKKRKHGAQGDKAEEKSSNFANTCLLIVIIAFTIILLYSKYHEEKYQKMRYYSKGFDLDSVRNS
jgi:hypothetical protein